MKHSNLQRSALTAGSCTRAPICSHRAATRGGGEPPMAQVGGRWAAPLFKRSLTLKWLGKTFHLSGVEKLCRRASHWVAPSMHEAGVRYFLTITPPAGADLLHRPLTLWGPANGNATVFFGAFIFLTRPTATVIFSMRASGPFPALWILTQWIFEIVVKINNYIWEIWARR